MPFKSKSFDDGVDKSGWPWKRHCNSHSGYGQFGHKYAHRVAYQNAFGEIPPRLFVLHRCDNRPCCNPSHLFLGTAHDNTQDMISKGRRYTRPKVRFCLQGHDADIIGRYSNRACKRCTDDRAKARDKDQRARRQAAPEQRS